MSRIICALACISSLVLGTPSSYKPAVDLRGVDKALTVQPTKVMVLGTAHLAGHNSLNPNRLNSLIDRLAEYAPNVITIEAVPGETCEMMRTFKSAYANTVANYCPQVAPFRRESGLSASAAADHIRKALAVWPTSPVASDRRRLAAAFLAYGEPHSALVQWWRLSPDDRQARDGLGPNSVDALQRLAVSMNENSQIGARLAARLKLERVYAVDDHSADIVLARHEGALWKRLSEIWASGDDEIITKYDAARDAIVAGCAIEAFRFYNAPATQLSSINNDFRLAMNDDAGERYGRIYNSWYQARNLRMVSNIVSAGANTPSSRVLAVVGASHKAYFEALLDTTHDIELINTETVLGRGSKTPACIPL